MAAVRVPPSACSTWRVQDDGALAQGFQIDGSTQAAADQALNLMGAARQLCHVRFRAGYG